MTVEQKQAYEWAKNQDYRSVAARYAKTLAGLVDELQEEIERLEEQLTIVTNDLAEECFGKAKTANEIKAEVAREIFADIENCLNSTNFLYTSDLAELKRKYIQEREE